MIRVSCAEEQDLSRKNEGDLGMTNRIWWWGSGSEDLRSVEVDCYYSQVHFESEWSYLLRSHL